MYLHNDIVTIFLVNEKYISYTYNLSNDHSHFQKDIVIEIQMLYIPRPISRPRQDTIQKVSWRTIAASAEALMEGK